MKRKAITFIWLFTIAAILIMLMAACAENQNVGQNSDNAAPDDSHMLPTLEPPSNTSSYIDTSSSVKDAGELFDFDIAFIGGTIRRKMTLQEFMNIYPDSLTLLDTYENVEVYWSDHWMYAGIEGVLLTYFFYDEAELETTLMSMVFYKFNVDFEDVRSLTTQLEKDTQQTFHPTTGIEKYSESIQLLDQYIHGESQDTDEALLIDPDLYIHMADTGMQNSITLIQAILRSYNENSSNRSLNALTEVLKEKTGAIYNYYEIELVISV